MLVLKGGFSRAVIILHEIYGVNQFISSVCQRYFSQGYDVYCPDLIDRAEPFGYHQQEEAYRAFSEEVWQRAREQAASLARDMRAEYQKLFLIGFSVGATIAWTLSQSGLCDGIVSYYGSRIRDRLHVQPKCRALLIFARQEAAFAPQMMLGSLQEKPGVQVHILQGGHGFMDSFSEHFHAASAREAEALTQRFLAGFISL